MKIRYLFLLFAFCYNTAWSDFSNSSATMHPLYSEASEPYIVEVRGEWPNDCHPGEQKPVISEYSGIAALIEFETIVEHVTCNDVVTPYRVLVDMSDVVGSVEGELRFTRITIRFDGAELETRMPDTSSLIHPSPPAPHIKPEEGIYYSDGLEKQGLLLARQNQRMGAYPLIYDESGSSEWLIGAGGIVEDVFFADLLESTGGQCLGCVPPDEPPQMGVVGKISMLMDSEGVVQVKINDGLFETYEPLSFGYGEFEIRDADTESPVIVPDLSGRWAFSENNSEMWGETTTPPTSVLPLVFDVTLRSNVTDPPFATIGTPVPLPIGFVPPSVFYAIVNIEGEMVAEMSCYSRGEFACDLKIPEFNNLYEEAYKVQLLSIERMIMTNTAPNDSHDGVGIGTGTAVRID